MKFLVFFLLFALAVCGYFWYTDGPGSGMNYVTIGIAVATVALLLFNRRRTGSWLSDSTTR